jgi:glycosyltransferase involved in cell wall biosynthesis
MSSSVSVIIPTFNRGAFIGRAIRSALSQCVPGDEVIVIDDGSTDDTRQVVATFGDAVRYHYVPNGGAGRARNLGVELATKDLVAFLDSDDEWFDGKLQMQRDLMDARRDVLFSFSNFAVTFRDGRQVRRYLRNWLTVQRSWDEAIGPGEPFSGITWLPAGRDDFLVHIGDMSRAELADNYVLTSSLVVRRREAGDSLRFAEDLPIYEDWYCFAQLSLRGPAAYLDCETTWQHGVAELRISDADELSRDRAWITMNERIWQREPAFRQQHAEYYERIVQKYQVQLARRLIAAGLMREARAVMADIQDVPRSYLLLAQAPGALIRYTSAARRWLLRWRPMQAATAHL